MACFIPEGGFDPDTGEPADPTGTPHIAQGMALTFDVTSD
jgi:hypothetical protein